VFSRKCIGWKLGRDIDAKLALAALDMALAGRRIWVFRTLFIILTREFNMPHVNMLIDSKKTGLISA